MSTSAAFEATLRSVDIPRQEQALLLGKAALGEARRILQEGHLLLKDVLLQQVELHLVLHLLPLRQEALVGRGAERRLSRKTFLLAAPVEEVDREARGKGVVGCPTRP